MSYITPETLQHFAFVNLDALEQPVRGVLLNCHGFGDESTFQTSPRPGTDLGKEGIVYIFPYYSPWAWCNDAAISYIDEVLDTVFSMLSLPPETPFMITGGSMGGLTAMIYSIFGKYKPLAVGCNCPVCDLEKEASEGGILTRSIYAAYVGEGKDVENEILRHSPIRMVNALPDLPYLIVSGQSDGAVTEKDHIFPIKEAMQRAGKNATFLSVPGMGHCNIGEFEDAYQIYLHFCLKNLGVEA